MIAEVNLCYLHDTLSFTLTSIQIKRWVLGFVPRLFSSPMRPWDDLLITSKVMKYLNHLQEAGLMGNVLDYSNFMKVSTISICMHS